MRYTIKQTLVPVTDGRPRALAGRGAFRTGCDGVPRGCRRLSGAARAVETGRLALPAAEMRMPAPLS